jgi:hypothetical protein
MTRGQRSAHRRLWLVLAPLLLLLVAFALLTRPDHPADLTQTRPHAEAGR